MNVSEGRAVEAEYTFSAVRKEILRDEILLLSLRNSDPIESIDRILLAGPESIYLGFLIACGSRGEINACMQHWWRGENLPRTARPLAFLFVAQGTCYFAYFLWRAVFSKMIFFRAPPGIIFLCEVYLLFALFASLYFLYTSYRLFRRQRSVGKSLLVTLSLSAMLWILPAILSFGNANTYLTNPNIPPETKAQWVHYLMTGVYFSAIGTMNIASILYTIYHLRRPQ